MTLLLSPLCYWFQCQPMTVTQRKMQSWPTTHWVKTSPSLHMEPFSLLVLWTTRDPTTCMSLSSWRWTKGRSLVPAPLQYGYVWLTSTMRHLSSPNTCEYEDFTGYLVLVKQKMVKKGKKKKSCDWIKLEICFEHFLWFQYERFRAV